MAIHVAGRKSAPMAAVDSVRAIAGKGLEGEHHFGEGAAPSRHVTLIEAEALEALARDLGIVLEPGASRRNLTTRGVELNSRVAREFRVGEVRLRGLKPCDPCEHLEKLTRPGVIKGLLRRGGLRAEILQGGTLHVGDEIRL
jgi:MOSC domain-containing protein YiiM